VVKNIASYSIDCEFVSRSGWRLTRIKFSRFYSWTKYITIPEDFSPKLWNLLLLTLPDLQMAFVDMAFLNVKLFLCTPRRNTSTHSYIRQIHTSNLFHYWAALLPEQMYPLCIKQNDGGGDVKLWNREEFLSPSRQLTKIHRLLALCIVFLSTELSRLLVWNMNKLTWRGTLSCLNKTKFDSWLSACIRYKEKSTNSRPMQSAR
jgi:hypothetical protein